MFLTIGVIIIDDIIKPDGSSKMAILGGGATHAAMGMRVWSDQVGILAFYGNDFPNNLTAELQSIFNLQGMLTKDVPTPRCWQIFEPDGHRHEIHRTDISDLESNLHKPEDFPDIYQCIKGIHLHSAPENVPIWSDFLHARKCVGNSGESESPLILWEPWDPFCVPENLSKFCEFGSLVDVVSPNLREAKLMTGLQDPEDIALCLLSKGIQVLVIRMGADGSLVAVTGEELVYIPAVPVEKIIDVTGAGNAYCGGYLVGYSESGSHKEAGRYGAVAASFTLEQYGALYPVDNLRQRALNRLGSIE